MNKNNFLSIIILVVFVFPLSIYAQTKNILFVGTYTTNNDKGIYVYDFDTVKYTLNLVSNTDKISNPAYLAISMDNKFVYCVNENGAKESGVCAFSFDTLSNSLKFLNQVKFEGDYPCYLTINKERKFLYTANYGGGSLTEVALNKDGSFSNRFKVKKFDGKSINENRQKSSHAHMCALSPNEENIWVSDLGTDKIYIYQFNKYRGVEEYLKGSIHSKPGSGPRHFSFHPKSHWVYILEEMKGTISAYKFSGASADFIETISNSDEVTDEKYSADIHISPDGKYLYATNRAKSNNIVGYSINSQTGMLTKIATYQTGASPRNFLITKDGSFLLVANQKSNSITIFKRDNNSGALTELNVVHDIPTPVCLKMLN